MDLTPLRVPLQHLAAVGEARRAARVLGREADLGPVAVERLALLAVEAASNVVRHGGGGDLFLRACLAPERPRLELLAIDRGVGMADVGRCRQDGFTTAVGSDAGTGTGLGAIARLADYHHVESQPRLGTVVVCGMQTGDGAQASTPALGVVATALAGESISGDAWQLLAPAPGRLRLVVADGLGHGPDAAAAAAAALAALAAAAAAPAAAALEAAHRATRHTRGAAVAVADVDLGARTLTYVGTGNIVGRVLGDGRSTGLASANGVVGAEMGRTRPYAHALGDARRLVMHSDGISGRWTPTDAAAAELCDADPSCLAARLWRDFGRSRDDATICVLALDGAPP